MDRPPETSIEGTASHSPTQADCRRLFDLSLDLLCIAGLDGYFKLVNPSWTRVLGWSEAELLSRPVAEFMHPEDRERTLQARAGLARGEMVRGLENRYLCKDGSYRWLSWQSVLGPDGATVYAVARDITERRRLDQEQLAFSKLECTGIFATGIAHDFNNLLASLRLSLDLLGVCGPINEEQQNSLRHAKKAVDMAKSLTRQLITFAQGGMQARQTIDLKKLLRQSVHLALEGSSLQRQCVLAEDLWPAEVDEVQIGQVICGLVLNAREASRADGVVCIQAENVATGTQPRPGLLAGDYVRIRVSDEGAGIPPEIMPKVFDPYFSTKERGSQKGMGMGLPICRSIIRKHGGLIEIESEPGRGTTVTCYLPARPNAG